jgi:hypothetical protein
LIELGTWAVQSDGIRNGEVRLSGTRIRSSKELSSQDTHVHGEEGVHDRMPVIVDREVSDLWLDPGMTHMQAVSDLLKPVMVS